MKITVFIIVFASIQTFALSNYAQTKRMDVKIEQSSIVSALEKIEAQSEFFFFYNNKVVKLDKKISVDLKDKTINEILDALFKDTDIEYTITNRQVVLSGKETGNLISEQQKKSISGKVTDSSGGLLPGVSVVLKGTTTGVITDNNGSYSINNVPEKATLQFSFVGMKMQELKTNGQTNLDVTLFEETVGIDEVVAIGYGTKKKKDIIGSIATIKSEELVQTSSASVINALQGRAAGVQITQNTGLSGSEYQVKIRGVHSINSGNDPLWIIDGIPGDANSLNPNDIETFDVLKDASATSIYGSRGSNGVVIITTKSGGAKKAEITIDFKTGVANMLKDDKDYGYANTDQFFAIVKEGRKNVGITEDWNPFDVLHVNADYVKPISLAEAQSTNNNWFKKLTRQGSYNDVNLTATGGSEKSSIFFSANYRDQKGVVLRDGLTKYSSRLNADFKPSKSITLGARMNIIYSKGETGSTDRIWPWMPFYDATDGTGYWNVHANSLASKDSKYSMSNNELLRGLGGVYAEIKVPFVNGLFLRTEESFDFTQSNHSDWQSATIRSLNTPNDGSRAGESSNISKTINYNLYLKYNKTFGDHNFSATGGTESTRSTNYYRAFGAQYLLGSYQELGHDPGKMNYMEGRQTFEDYLRSYFGRADYKYKDKYLLGISVRRDGSSRFTPDYRWGIFTAYSAGWIISEENFMKQFDKVSLLKLRASYGQTGNNQVPYFRTQSFYQNSFDYNYGLKTEISAGTKIQVMGNKELTWETTTSYDLGVDYGFFKNKIQGSIAYYLQDVNGLVLAQPLPAATGLAGGNEIWANVGRILNQGLEFTISSVNISNGNFKWTTDFNIATNGSLVKNLTPDLDAFNKGIWQDKWFTKTGGPLRVYSGAQYVGVDPEKGVYMIMESDRDLYDKTGEIKLTGRAIPATDDNVQNTHSYDTKKTPIPKYYGGLSNTFSYKGFDLTALVTFSGGNYIFDSERASTSFVEYGELTAYNSAILDKSWKKPGDVVEYAQLRWQDSYQWGWDTEKPNTNSPTSKGDWKFSQAGGEKYNTGGSFSKFLYKGDYARLKYIEFAYNLTQTACKKLSLKNFRVYVSAQNLFTLTKYPGWDPEIGSSGMSSWGVTGGQYNGDYTMNRTFSFGASVKF